MDLIIDTSTARLIVILVDKDKIDYVENLVSNKHQASLLSDIETLLLKNKCKLSDIETFGVVVGPGSFTGVRLSVATVKAFNFVNKKQKIVAINNLDLLNFICKNEKNDYAIAIKSTSSKCYLSKVCKNIRQDFLATNEQVEDLDCDVFGYDIDKIGTKKVEKLQVKVQDYVEFFLTQKQKKNFVDYVSLEPVYMALSQAEEELLKKNG